MSFRRLHLIVFICVFLLFVESYTIDYENENSDGDYESAFAKRNQLYNWQVANMMRKRSDARYDWQVANMMRKRNNGLLPDTKQVNLNTLENITVL